ncbi:MAG: amidohydrolase family protein [Gemmatimonadota bacterium]
MRRPTPLLVAVLLCAACGPSEPAPDLAIENVTVVDAEQGALPGRTVVVDDGRIVSVTEAGTPSGANRVVDGTGRFLIPGLWDFHVHFTFDERFTDAMPGLFLAHGVTSVRDTGGPLEAMLPVVERLRSGAEPAPRVFFAGPLLDGEAVVYDGVNNPLLGIANPDPETARANVARLAEAGVDFIKIYELVSPEVFEALVDAAGEHGLPIDGHVPLSLLARDVGPRVNSLEHLRNLEMDCATDAEAMLAERRAILDAHDDPAGAALRSRLHGMHRLPSIASPDPARCAELAAALQETIQVPTLRLNAMGVVSPFDRDDFPIVLDRVPEEAAASWREALAEAGDEPVRDNTHGQWSLDFVGMLHEAGVPVGAGTDTPIGYAVPGYSLHSELEMLVRAGLSPRDALRAATVRPAEFFGLEGEMGTVEAGMLADLVLLSANPLDDIRNTRTVEAVVTKGELLDQEALAELTGG